MINQGSITRVARAKHNIESGRWRLKKFVNESASWWEDHSTAKLGNCYLRTAHLESQYLYQVNLYAGDLSALHNTHIPRAEAERRARNAPRR